MLQAATAPTGGLATWLRMSSHLSKPAEAAAEPASPADSDASKASTGSGGARTHTVTSLDFNTAEAKAAVDSASAVPAAPAPKATTKPAGSAQPAVAAAPKTSQRVAASQPTQTGTERHAAAARTERSSLLALPAVQLLLLCLLLPCLLLAAPLSMRAFDPALTQRYMRGGCHGMDCAVKLRSKGSPAVLGFALPDPAIHLCAPMPSCPLWRQSSTAICAYKCASFCLCRPHARRGCPHPPAERSNLPSCQPTE